MGANGPRGPAEASFQLIDSELGSGRTKRRIYGRRVGPRMRAGRRRLVDSLLPSLQVALPEQGQIDPSALFDHAVAEIWLEIGFGGGEHLASQARAHPDVGFIGVEPFLTGVAKLLVACDSEKLVNVRILVDDARLLITALPESSISKIFVLFPDPWPKVRHHKRRIVNEETVAEFARILAPGGELRLATDDPDYARWMLAALLRERRLSWLAVRAADWREAPEDWVATRYEAKAQAAGRPPIHLSFAREVEEP